MTSDEWSGALLAALGGVALGGFFFGGLWWTLQRTLRSAHVVSWQLASLLVRNAVALGEAGGSARVEWLKAPP